MLDRAERRFNLKPKRLAADTAYGSGRFLGWLVDRGVAPHIPVRDASERDDGTFSRSDFRWDGRQGVYICPNNKVLHTTGRVHDGNMLRRSLIRRPKLAATLRHSLSNRLWKS
jgi:hypothetical protein